MKISLTNFGPIKDFYIDLSDDFHLIVGRNNVGKSYAITAVYLVIKAFHESFRSVSSLNFLAREGELPEWAEEALEDVASLQSGQECDITSQHELFVKSMLNETLIPEMEELLKGSYDSIESLQNVFSEEAASLSIDLESAHIILKFSGEHVEIAEVNVKRKIFAKAVKPKRKTKMDASRATIYSSLDDSGHFKRVFSIYAIHTISLMYSSVYEIASDIHYLPASRSGLYQALSAFGQIIANLSQSRSFLKRKIELPAISVPLSDYYIKLSEIKVTRAKKETTPSAVLQIADRIEKEILKGSVRFDQSTKRLFYRPEGTKLDLDLSSTSSMVSELSPIVSYLRYIISPESPSSLFARRYPFPARRGERPKHIVIIEEPEAHLHPDIQIKLVEIFNSLLDENIKLIITSHSNYIFSKVNNLILGKNLLPDRAAAYLFKEGREGSSCVLLAKDDLGIEDSNFLDVSENLYEEKIELIERLNNRARPNNE